MTKWLLCDYGEVLAMAPSPSTKPRSKLKLAQAPSFGQRPGSTGPRMIEANTSGLWWSTAVSKRPGGSIPFGR